LLAGATDADSDPLAIIAVSPTSTNGGTVTLNGGNVDYLPATNYIGADEFTYTVSDGRGGTAIGTVQVSVYSADGLSPNVVYGPTIVGTNFVVRFAGIPGFTYTIEGTDILTPPNWQKQINLTAPTTNEGNGIGIFEFSTPVSSGPAYFRTVYPSY
jgi:hypothetical protein